MSSSLRVCFDGRSLTAPVLRGWDRYTVGLMQALARLGVDVTLVHLPAAPPRLEHFPEVRVTCLPIPARRGLSWEQLALPRLLRAKAMDIYHAPAEHGVPLLSPCPTVLTVHSVIAYSYRTLVAEQVLPGMVADYLGYPFSDTDWRGRYWRLQIDRATCLCVPSEYCRTELVRQLRVPPVRVHVTPLALPGAFHAPPRSRSERLSVLARLGVTPPYLLYVGGYETHKNPRGLLHAFAAVAPQRPDLKLVLVGSQEAPAALRQLAEALGLSAKVHFLAAIGAELPDLYDEADLFVSLSWLETFCLPALEAMSRGVLPVTTGWGALPEVVGDVGWLVDPRDPSAAASAVLGALLAPDKVERRRRGYDRIKRFSWDETARLTLKVYESLLRHRRG